MQSAAACPSCQYVGPFDSDVCPQCQGRLFFKSSTKFEEPLTHMRQEGEAPAEPMRARAETGLRKYGDTQNRGSSLAMAIQPFVKTQYEQAQKALPQVCLSLQHFLEKIVAILEKHLPHLSPRESDIKKDNTTLQFLSVLKWQELFLTTACAEGDAAAWQVFQSLYENVIQKTARCCAENASEAKELSDSLMTDLFLPTSTDSGEKTNKIGQYHGMGSLEGWIKVLVSRMAIDQIRRQRKQLSLEDLGIEQVTPTSSTQAAGFMQEMDHQKVSNYFTASLKYAIHQLTSQEKLILNLYYLQDVNLKQIGKLLKVHESTASRTVDRLKKQLRRSVEKHLREYFHVRPGEIRQFIEMAQSQVEVDFKKILAK